MFRHRIILLFFQDWWVFMIRDAKCFILLKAQSGVFYFWLFLPFPALLRAEKNGFGIKCSIVFHTFYKVMHFLRLFQMSNFDIEWFLPEIPSPLFVVVVVALLFDFKIPTPSLGSWDRGFCSTISFSTCLRYLIDLIQTNIFWLRKDFFEGERLRCITLWLVTVRWS